MKRLVIAAFAATFSISTFATGYTWKAVSNVFDGMFTDPAHWDPTREIYPGQPDAEESELGNNALFDFFGNTQDGLAPNIYWPDGVITNFAGMTLRTTKDTVITVYGTNTTLVLPKPTNGTRGWGYGFKAIVGTSVDSNLINFDYSWGPLTAEPGVFSNFVIRTRNPASMRKLEFVQGLFDFHNSGYQLFFQESVANAENRKGTKDAIIEVGTNATVNIDSNLDAFCPSTNNIFRIFGTANVEQSIRIPGQRQNVGYDSPVKREILFDVRKGGVFAYGLTSGHDLQLGRNPGGYYGSSTSIVVRVSADGGTIVQKGGYYSTKSAGPGRHVLEFKNGSTGSFAGMVSLGTVNMSTGVVSIANSTVSFANLLTLGGSSAAAVTGGAHGEFSATDSTVSFTNSLCLNNGSVTLGNGADIALASASRIYGVSTYGGTRSFAADGASVSVGTATDPIAGFDTATIGDGGLSITANGDIELSQSFSGAGTLTLSGSGAKTVSGDIECARVVVSGGNATFTGNVTAEVVSTNGASVAFSGNAATQSTPLGGLRLGDRTAQTLGRLTVQPNETVWVDGPVDLQCLRIAISGAAAVGDSFAVACMRGAGESVREELTKLDVVSGLPANATCAVSEEEMAGGGRKFVVTLCSMTPVTIALASGADTHATNIVYGFREELDVVPETDSVLRFEGDVGYGALVKTGGGAAYLSGANSFVAGFVMNGGLLSFATGASVGDTWESRPSVLRDGTLEFLGETTLVNPIEINASSGDNGLVVFKNEADVTMPIPTVTQGAIVKRGKGRLTFEVKADVDWSGLKKGSDNASSGEQMVFDDANGTSPAMTSYGVVNVAEGELVMRGVGASKPTISFAPGTSANHTVVGISSSPAPANPAQPGLVLDNVAYESVAGFVDGGYDMYVSRQVTGATASFLVAPYLYITNGASLKVNGFALGYGSNDDQVHVDLLLDNGEIMVCYELHLSENLQAKKNHNTTNNIVLRNGSRLFASYDKGRLHLTGTSSRFDVDGSTIARNASGAPLGMFFSDRSGSGVDMTFRNGSYFGCYMIGMNGASSPQSGQHPNYPIHLTFDDSEWYLGAGNLTLPSSNMNVRVTVVGGGLKLNPPVGSTWRLYTRVDGSAGIVKGGAGTLLVDRQFKYHEYVEADPVTLAYEGRTEVLDGTLSVVPGAMAAENAAFFVANGATLDLQGAEVSGLDLAVTNSATLSRAALSGATFRIAYDDASGTFARLELSNVTTSGRTAIDFGRSTENPLPRKIEGLPVGSWTGAKPDVSSWRGVNGGITGRSYAFAATDGGDIVATSVCGITIFVR